MAGWHGALAEFLLCLCVAIYFVWLALRSTHPADETDPKSARLAEARANLVASSDLQPLDEAFRVQRFGGDRSSKRITAFTIALARALKIPRDEITAIARAAFLRDIGMPPTIVDKPRVFTPAEINAMREHCYRGYEMLRKSPHLTDSADIVYSHEEWFDGTGYPRGLKSGDIPIGARIVSVATAINALAFDNPNHEAGSLQSARQQIRRRAGRQFDPKVVNAFLSMPEKIWEDLRKQADSGPPLS